MKKHNPNWLDELKNASDAEEHDVRQRRPIKSLAHQEQLANIRREAKARNHGRRATDSEIASAILLHEPELAKAQFRKAIRKLEEHFETALDLTGPQSARDIIERVHIITGDRRRK